jgi:S-adenosylmethionine-diacylglycerol 3-amino-3-carboxypropyl transferase
MKTDDWVDRAARLPIAFAQVREDSLLDQSVVEQLGQEVKILMVASGGCSAAALAAMPQVATLHVVDPNPAQISLTRLKLRLLRVADPPERLAILGHSRMSRTERSQNLAAELRALNLPTDALGPPDLVSRFGPDHVGRYEAVFAQLRDSLCGVEDDLAEALQLRDPGEQSSRVQRTTPLGRALELAFRSTMALPILVKLFGEGATRNRRRPFARNFIERTRRVLAALPAAENPYLWQMLKGCFPPHSAYPWLETRRTNRMPRVAWTITSMDRALRALPRSLDFVHLSNILDWLSLQSARTTLDLAWRSLRPGGVTLIRQLNSNLNIESLAPRFAWQTDAANALHRRDRSFFYRRLYLGRKP